MTVSASVDKLLQLIEFGIHISGIKELKQLMEKVLKTAQDLTYAKMAVFYLVTDDSLELVARRNTHTFHIPDNFHEKKLIPISPNRLAGFCVLNSKIVNISAADRQGLVDTYDLEHELGLLNLQLFHSMLLVPLINQNRKILGVLQLIDSTNNEGDFIPFSESIIPVMESLASQSAVAIQNAQLSRDITSTYYETIFRLSLAAECRDKETANHIFRVSSYSKIIARYAGFTKSFQDMIQYSSPMHDVGKLGIPDSILFKTGKLTPEERILMQSHTEIGWKIFEGSDYEILQMAGRVALSHHEKYDGSGYPKGLKGNIIPVEGRIVAIADVFDALCSIRRYKFSFPTDQVFMNLKSETGHHFDPILLNAFFMGLEEILEVKKKYTVSES